MTCCTMSRVPRQAVQAGSGDRPDMPPSQEVQSGTVPVEQAAVDDVLPARNARVGHRVAVAEVGLQLRACAPSRVTDSSACCTILAGGHAGQAVAPPHVHESTALCMQLPPQTGLNLADGVPGSRCAAQLPDHGIWSALVSHSPVTWRMRSNKRSTSSSSDLGQTLPSTHSPE